MPHYCYTLSITARCEDLEDQEQRAQRGRVEHFTDMDVTLANLTGKSSTFQSFVPDDKASLVPQMGSLCLMLG